jgi:membrane protease YdiL (CAAX protease family)
MFEQAAISATVNLVIFVAFPFLFYFAYHKWRHKRRFVEVAHRAGLQLGELRYAAYGLAFAFVAVILLMLWPPLLEPILREGSAWKKFAGLGLSGSSLLMALLYGVVQTGFAEEFFFRGLIAGSLSRRLPVAWANALQALAFIAPHLIFLRIMPELWSDLIYIFIGALFAGWLRIKSDSMLGGWLIHASVNVTMGLSVAIRTAT